MIKYILNIMIKNINELSITEKRKQLLEILDFGLEETKTSHVLGLSLKREGSKFSVQGNEFNLDKYKKILILGIGKASGEGCQVLEKLLHDKIDAGLCIDVQERDFNIIVLTIGTHPNSSEKNFSFTQNAISMFENLAEDDLLITIISGGGSALFCYPYETECIAEVELFKELTKKGANIQEINTIRKHLSLVKGGGLAKIAYPATIISLIFSDVPSNDISFVASGPTVKDSTKVEDARKVLEKYDIPYKGDFFETPKEDKYFKKVHNFLLCSGKTTLNEMLKKAKEMNLPAVIFKSDFQEDADITGKILLENAKGGELLLAAGETIVKIRGDGKGGRNQELALSALNYINEGDIVISCASDGYDNTESAGAIADAETLKKAQEQNLDIQKYLDNNDSFNFFTITKDQIMTGKTGLNVSDIFLVYKK